MGAFPWTKLGVPVLVEVLPNPDKVQLGCFGNPDVGMDATDIKELFVPGPEFFMEQYEGMPVSAPILVVFFCSIPSLFM